MLIAVAVIQYPILLRLALAKSNLAHWKVDLIEVDHVVNVVHLHSVSK